MNHNLEKPGNDSQEIRRNRRRKPRTITKFDSYSSSAAGDTAASSVTTSQLQIRSPSKIQTPRSLVIESLLEQLCDYLEPDHTKRKILFQKMCQNLSSLNVIRNKKELYSTREVRFKFRVAFSKYITDLKASIELQYPDPLGTNKVISLLPEWNRRSSLSSCLYQLNVLKSDFWEFNTKQYERDFEELDMIDKGAFGVVYKAKKRVENVVYAVKKIPFSCDNDPLLPQVLKEVQLFARLSHNNVVGYKTAWIEPESGDVAQLFGSSEEISSEITLEKSESNSRYRENTSSNSFNCINDDFVKKNDPNVDDAASIKSLTNLVESKLTVEEYEEMLDAMCEKYDSTELLEEMKLSSVVNADSNSNRHRHWSGATSVSLSDSELENNIDSIDSFPKRDEDLSSLVPMGTLVRSTSLNRGKTICFDNGGFTVNKMAVLYVQMELCEKSLRNWIDERNSKNPVVVDVKNSTEIFKQILKGVSYVHGQNLMHRDLKPQNILFDYQGRIKIGDFGLATACCGNKCSTEASRPRSARHSGHKHSKGVGTSPYAAPEVRTQTNYDFKADMYSLGVILLELFYSFDTAMERARVLDDLTLARLSDDFQQKYPKQAKIILELTNSDPNIRPDATEVLNSTLFLSKTQIIERQKLEIKQLKKQIAALRKELLKKSKTNHVPKI